MHFCAERDIGYGNVIPSPSFPTKQREREIIQNTDVFKKKKKKKKKINFIIQRKIVTKRKKKDQIGVIE